MNFDFWFVVCGFWFVVSGSWFLLCFHLRNLRHLRMSCVFSQTLASTYPQMTQITQMKRLE
jgi:hypothetical protein